MKQKLFTKLMSLFLAIVLLFGMFPGTALTASAAPAADIPAKMLDNYVLDSLQYVGYNINYLKESGLIYQTGGHGGAVPTSVLSGIKYGGNLFGVCTVADP